MQQNDKNDAVTSSKTGYLLLAFGLTMGTLCGIFGGDVAENAEEIYTKATTAMHQMSKPETIMRLAQH